MSQQAGAFVLKRAADKADSAVPANAASTRYSWRSRAFPISSGTPSLPSRIRDEILEYYAFVFCQGGFGQLGMTFEQFLLVVAEVGPNRLQADGKTDGDRLINFPTVWGRRTTETGRRNRA